MNYLPTGQEIKQADQYTINELQISGRSLMEAAARGVLSQLVAEGLDLTRVLLVCGAGNNGGDGFALAWMLKELGYTPQILFWGKEEKLTAESRYQKDKSQEMGVDFQTTLAEDEYTVIVDALFGAGLDRELSGSYQELINTLNNYSGKKVAIDLPSGIHAGSGEILGAAFKADITIAVQCPKLGLFLYPGKGWAGKVIPIDIGITESLFAADKEVAAALTQKEYAAMLPRRLRDSHKGTYGKLLIIAGSKGMAGAALLNGMSAYRSGTGLVQIYTHEDNRVILQSLLYEGIMKTYQTYQEESLEEALAWADVILMGSGLGLSQDSRQIVSYVLTHTNKPLVIDGDALRIISEEAGLMATLPGKNRILTPHLREMERLTGKSVNAIKSERKSVIINFCKKYECTVVLKDSVTISYRLGERLVVNTSGNAGLAKAGSGDVLAGTISGLISANSKQVKDASSFYEQVLAGVYIHGKAGEEASEKWGMSGVMARDLLPEIGRCIKELERRRKE